MVVVTSALAQTGSLKGRITDKTTKEGLPSVTVLVKGTYYGASTDVDGYYTIPKINPGTYVVDVKLIGYKMVQYPALKITAGATTTQNVQLEETSLSLGQEIIVEGERPIFNIEETSSKHAIKSEDIAVAEVKNIQDIVSMQVGVVKSDDQIHIRGGRSYETAYVIDGISVQDPLAGTGFGAQLPTDAIEEAEVITGGFNAEYGQATSGVVHLTTKDGGDVYTGSLSHKQDHFGFNDNSRSNWNTDIYDFSLSGPDVITQKLLPALGVEIPGTVSFFVNGDINLSDGYLRWVETINSDGMPNGWTVKAPHGLKSSLISASGFMPRRDNQWSGFGKLTWKITPTVKLSYAVSYSLTANQNTQSIQTTLDYQEPQPGYQYLFQNIPDSANTFAQINIQQSLTLTNVINTRTFYELRLSRYTSHLRADAGGKSWEQYTEPKDIVTLPLIYRNVGGDTVTVIPGDGFYDTGSPYYWRDQFFNEYTVKFDLTSNLNEKNKFKSGIEMRFQNIQMIDIYEPWVRPMGYDNDIYAVNAAMGALYAQDNLTFGGMILNFGLRFDYWFPGKYVDDAMRNDSTSLVNSTIRNKYFEDTYSLFGRRWKGRLSPRIAIAHPISDNQTFTFSYGHYSKFPRPQYVYTKLVKTNARATTQTIGNPDLNPETTVAYEVGLHNQLSENDALNVTAYYKDIFDYITAKSVTYSTGTYTTYINLDYARTRGIEVEYIKRYSDWFRGNASVSYSLGTGKSSSAEEALYSIQQGTDENVKESPLIWNRPFSGSLFLNFRVKKGRPLFGFGNGILDDYNIYTRLFYESGKRYTSLIYAGTDASTGRPYYVSDENNINGAIGEDIMTVDLNFEKYFTVNKLTFVVSLEISNLLDRKNAQIINAATGKAYEPTQSNGSWTPTPNSWNDPHYPELQAPVDPYPYNPARYQEPRHYLFGLAVKF
jgi:outer membrane receptor protein involved in Fe transport